MAAGDGGERLEESLQNLVEERTLRWIFVGGKGGVGKTTTSCSLAVQLAASRESVLVVSTDPAHNVSDAFGQKFGKAPTPVEGFANLHCMEIDPTAALEGLEGAGGAEGGGEGAGLGSFVKDLGGAIPGIDEAMGFAELLRFVVDARFSVVVFDTAPTGHTLRMLQVPHVISKALERLDALRGSMGGMLDAVGGMMMMGGAGGAEGVGTMLRDRLEMLRASVGKVIAQFKDPSLTTFVCVCIPEFLSLYETERLVQELAKLDIDARNIVVNQVLVPDDAAKCPVCAARSKMQSKYLAQIDELYGEDFHVVRMPLQRSEVRGPDALRAFGALLVDETRRRAALATPS
jgi:arsenite-transporting ATPase